MTNLCPEVTQGRGMDGVESITIREIHEVIRRFIMNYQRPMGRFMNTMKRRHRVPYLDIQI